MANQNSGDRSSIESIPLIEVKRPPAVEELPLDVEKAIRRDRDANVCDAVRQWLTGGNVDAQSKAGSETALHLAAQYGNYDLCVILLDNHADMEKQNDKENTPVHDAAVAGHTKIVKMFFDKEPNCVNLKGNAGKTPLHLAAHCGHPETVDYILSCNPDVYARSNDGETPLDCAVSVGYPGRVNPIVKSLVERGPQPPDPEALTTSFVAASVEYRYIDTALFLLDKMDKEAEFTPEIFMKIVKAGNETIPKAILERKKWYVALRGREEFSKHSTTPFRLLIERMPTVAKIVLDKCTVPGEDKDNPYSKNYKVKYNYEFIEDQDGEKGPKDSEQPWDLSYGNDYADLDETEHPRWGPKGSWTSISNHPLKKMVLKKRLDLLKHPVVESFIHRKWIRSGIFWYIINFVLYAVFLAFLTTFALVVPRPQLADCHTVNTTDCPGLFVSRFTPGVMAGFVLLFIPVCFVTEIILMVIQGWYYFTEWVNLIIKFPLFICSIIFVCMPNWSCPCVHAWQWQIGVVAVFLGWFMFVVLSSLIPVFGIYVFIFLEICKTFLKTTLLSLLLIVLFGLTFFMIFSDLDPNVQRSPFESPLRSLFKIMTMTTGELDYDAIFRLDPSGGSNTLQELEYLSMSYILWIPFVILMPVLFLNLLTALAVGDTNAVRQGAILRLLSFQIDQILTADVVFRRKRMNFADISPNDSEERSEIIQFIHNIYEEYLNSFTLQPVGYNKVENIISISKNVCNTETSNLQAGTDASMLREISEKLDQLLQHLPVDRADAPPAGHGHRLIPRAHTRETEV